MKICFSWCKVRLQIQFTYIMCVFVLVLVLCMQSMFVAPIEKKNITKETKKKMSLLDGTIKWFEYPTKNRIRLQFTKEILGFNGNCTVYTATHRFMGQFIGMFVKHDSLHLIPHVLLLHHTFFVRFIWPDTFSAYMFIAFKFETSCVELQVKRKKMSKNFRSICIKCMAKHIF